MKPDNDFIFEKYSFDPESGEAVFSYRYADGPSFVETLHFPLARRTLSDADTKALDTAIRLLYLLSGVSYYKAYAPTKLVCEAFPLDTETAAFVENVYRKGLAEFAYTNKLDLADRLHFFATDAATPKLQPLTLAERLLVPVGGGKDSIVSIECLKTANEDVTLFALGGAAGAAQPIQDTARAAERPLLYVGRTLSPELAKLNDSGAYNGHVPITAIVSATAVVTAILQDFKTVVLSNEHSASAPNLTENGIDVNHQYSKSYEFEKDFSEYVHAHVSPDLSYFSLLRPLTETAIARAFSKLDAYHLFFRSCNTAFKQDPTKRNSRWCGNCPKCRFVFLALAPFVSKEHLVEIFGANLLDDPAQLEGFKELVGLTAFKPFECVGEIEESALLMQKLSTMPEWQNSVIVRELAPLVAKKDSDFDAAYAALFEPKSPHSVPEQYEKFIFTYARD